MFCPAACPAEVASSQQVLSCGGIERGREQVVCYSVAVLTGLRISGRAESSLLPSRDSSVTVSCFVIGLGEG